MEDTVINSIVRSSLSFFGPKEKSTNESIELAKICVEYNLSYGAHLSL